ncbi:MAG: hypothetical protein HWQ43_07335 [Nostoc sp. JL31]|uniref:hypothetical protein n=1 Tax=Nostoc sp. JL31 TaxID=2815395 RepID=UPI0025D11280|nr:hypothetical protein [Nostoc sp. JL31]MBN3888983.1 hypothetical protein [Nostoc sp. JL31]
MDWLERVTEIRTTCNVPAPARNIAIARIWVDESSTEQCQRPICPILEMDKSIVLWVRLCFSAL